MSKGRRVPPPTAAQIRAWEVDTTAPTEAKWEQAEAYRTLEDRFIAVGTCRNTQTDHWHTWMSLYGTDLASVGVYGTEAEAQQFAVAVGRVIQEWGDDEASTARLNGLVDQGVGEMVVPPDQATLPDDLVREILAAIAERQERRN